MNVAFGAVSITLGLVYCALGAIAVAEVVRDYRTRGVSKFGLAFAAMAASCGPHHIIHGVHSIEGYDTNNLMFLSVLIGLPAGVTFILLRVETMTGRRGDRFVTGTPAWLVAAPLVFAGAAGLLVGGEIVEIGLGHPITWSAFLPNAFVVVTYSMVGMLLLRTQLRRRVDEGGWSLSGLSLGAIFPTCALMHLVYALGARGDAHIAPADLFGVPASAYFLWVVHGLYRQAIVDWNRRPIVGTPRRAARPAPWQARPGGVRGSSAPTRPSSTSPTPPLPC